MMLTKEKLLALVSLLLALFVLLDLQGRVPGSEAPPQLPAEEDARSYRSVSAAPVLAPEKIFSASRDPFQLQDMWSEAPPALLGVPPRQTWGRALPGGPRSLPRSPGDRIVVNALPSAGGGQ
jgi:hypothetical protein